MSNPAFGLLYGEILSFLGFQGGPTEPARPVQKVAGAMPTGENVFSGD